MVCKKGSFLSIYFAAESVSLNETRETSLFEITSTFCKCKLSANALGKLLVEMACKTLSEEYEIPETEEDSPLTPYKPISKIAQSLHSGNLNVGQAQVVNDAVGEPIQPKGADGKESCTAVDKTPTIIETSNSNDCSAGAKSNLTSDKTHQKRPVVFMCSTELVAACNKMLKIPGRAAMVSSLIESYSLHRFMNVVQPEQASLDELCAFHCREYLEFLQKLSIQDDIEKYDEESQLYGLGYDCPAHPGVYEYAALVAGASIQGAQFLIDGGANIVINWFGGWHHAKKDAAAGFCYTNDAVLGILKLREKFNRVLYIDLDLHHGDGVEDAFCCTNKVMTFSVHKHAVGFYPGTGGIKDVGSGKGRYYSVNIPVKDGVRDAEYAELVIRLLKKVKTKFNPEAVLIQCGADGITGDPHESFNLTRRGLASCVYSVLKWNLPTLLLGGGGYNHANTARLWAYLTGIAVGRPLPLAIPDHEHLMEYGPDYDLEISAGNMKNHNTREYLQSVYSEVSRNLDMLP